MEHLPYRFALAVGLASVAASPSAAAEKDGVAALLDQQKVKYELDKDKDYKIVYEFSDEKRSQIVYVSGTTEDFEGHKIRTVFAPAALLSKDRIDGQLKTLLEYNGKSKVGAWEINGDALYFAAKLLEPLTAEELTAMLNLVSSIADDKEIEISGDRDEL